MKHIILINLVLILLVTNIKAQQHKLMEDAIYLDKIEDGIIYIDTNIVVSEYENTVNVFVSYFAGKEKLFDEKKIVLTWWCFKINCKENTFYWLIHQDDYDDQSIFIEGPSKTGWIKIKKGSLEEIVKKYICK